MQTAPETLPTLLEEALTRHRAGDLEGAAPLYERVLADAPDNLDALHLSGILARQRGDAGTAAERLTRVLSLKPDLASAHHHLGLLRLAEEDWTGAIRHLRDALDLEPDNVASLAALAQALERSGDTSGAEAGLRAAIAKAPGETSLQGALGALLIDTGRPIEALEVLRHALTLAPEDGDLRVNLAVAELLTGRPENSLAEAEEAVRVAPENALAHAALANALRVVGKPLEAIGPALEALHLDPTDPRSWHNFANGLVGLTFSRPRPDLRAAILAALKRDDIEHQLLAQAGTSLLLAEGPVAEACTCREAPDFDRLLTGRPLDDPLLLSLMRRTTLKSRPLERLLTGLRAALLRASSEGRRPWRSLLLALAHQAFTNEYVYFESEAESATVADLDDPLLLACYRPLHKAALADRLVERPTEGLEDLIRRQVIEPREEARLKTEIPALTPISEGVSKTVRGQYEENPFPRWTTPPQKHPRPLAAVLTELFPHLAPDTFDFPSEPKVLVAGCGTGRQPLLTRARVQGARVLAVDLSLSSIAYGLRKAHELGDEAITFAQADISELDRLEERFDLIESFGVLHHMGDPEAGLGVLTGLLKPGGVMMLGLYSEIARRDVVAARQRIAALGLNGTPDDIRRFRHDVMESDLFQAWASATGSDGSFWTLSECRDLLFHVHEHRYTLPDLDALLKRAGLEFLGFELYHPWDRAAYLAAFPDDPAATSLDNWHRFERDHPDTFANTYTFWVRKPY